MIPTTGTIFNLIEQIAQQLAPRYEDYMLCHQYAWWMVQAIKNESQASLIGHSTIHLTPDQRNTLCLWIEKQLKEHMPLQYLLGSVPFNDVEIFVESPILIPRPETEEWCAELIAKLKNAQIEKINILDLCSGSGCITLALAKALPCSSLVGVDILEQAVVLGRKNAQHNKISNVQFLHSDLFEQVPPSSFDIIVSNPPYIDEQEWRYLDTSVTKWEDKNALIASDNGLAIIKKIIMNAHRYLSQNKKLSQQNIPQLWIEIDHTQGAAVKELMEAAGFANVRVMQDLERKDRVVTGNVL